MAESENCFQISFVLVRFKFILTLNTYNEYFIDTVSNIIEINVENQAIKEKFMIKRSVKLKRLTYLKLEKFRAREVSRVKTINFTKKK